MSKYTPNPRTYTKRNYVEAVEIITPNTYLQEDLDLSGKELNPVSQIINSHTAIANTLSTYLDISAIANTHTSAIGTIGGVSKYFVKQNNLTKVSTETLNNKLLIPLGYETSDYTTSADFNTFLSGTFLPMVQNEPTSLEANISVLSAYTSNSDASSVHNYLIENLGWFYFLNTSADGSLAYSPSSFLLDSFNTLYKGQSLDLVDGMKGVTNYIWRNLATCSTFIDIPSDYLSGTATYTSGTQQLEKLETMLDIIYSPLGIDDTDFAVKSALDDFMDAGVILDDYISKGPHRKLNTALGYAFADRAGESERIGLLYDIQNAPLDLLPHMAKLIGWDLLGPESEKWRQQLRSAVEVYKSKGTKKAIQQTIDMVLSNSELDVSGNVVELWESYVPHLIWYALGTESVHLESLSTWTLDLASKSGVNNYDYFSLEKNIKIVVDYILLDMYRAYPNTFSFAEGVFPVSRFYVSDNFGEPADFYAVGHDPEAKDYIYISEESDEYDISRNDAKKSGKISAWKASKALGPLGYGIYMTGSKYSLSSEYLIHKGDPFFVFNFRGHNNFPIPPFEELKYYEEWRLNKQLLDYLEDRLKCFGVSETFASQVASYIEGASLTSDSNLQSLNSTLLLFDSPQNAPNFNTVITNTSTYQKNLLDLWCGKSSHIFLDFESSDFDFTSTNLDGTGKYGLQNLSNVVKKFAPAHAIPKVNLNASSTDSLTLSSVNFEFLDLKKDDNTGGYNVESVLGNGVVSGVNVRNLAGGNKFKRFSEGSKVSNVDHMGTLEPGANFISPSPTATLADYWSGQFGRSSLRRRNYKFTLPKEGYYDRTGFNGPVSWDPSALENSTLSSQGELVLGFIPSSQSFSPVVDGQASGIWHSCENLDSNSTFHGVDTSNTFPYRGLSSLGSNYFSTSAHAWYVDRGQSPGIYGVMHKALEEKARHNAEDLLDGQEVKVSTYLANEKDNIFIDSLNLSGESWLHGANSVVTLGDSLAPDGTQTGDLLAVTTPVGSTDFIREFFMSGASYAELLEVSDDDYYTVRTLLAVGEGPYYTKPIVVKASITGGSEIPTETIQVSCTLHDGVMVIQPPNTDEHSSSTPIGGDPNGQEGLPPYFGDSAVSFLPVNDSWYELRFRLKRLSLAQVMTFDISFGDDTSDPFTLARSVRIWGTQFVKGEHVAEFKDTPLGEDLSYKDVITSYANSAIASGLLLDTFDAYQNFAFGSDLHKVFNKYTSFYNTHGLGKNSVDTNGFSILAHTYGKGLHNIDFQLDGSAATTSEGTYRTTELSSAIPISYGAGSGVFSVCAVEQYGPGYASGTYIASSNGDSVVPLGGTFVQGSANHAEFRNPHILSGIEFVNTSGSSEDNAFYLYDVPPVSQNNAKNQYYMGNPMIKCKSKTGFPRLRFDLSAYGTRNHLIENHRFNLSVKALVGNENESTVGNGLMGVWIHTKSEGGKLWSWAPKTPFTEYVPTYEGGVAPGTEVDKPTLPNQIPGGSWVLTDESDLSKELVMNSLSFKHQFHPNPLEYSKFDEVTCLGNKDTITQNLKDNKAVIKNFNDSSFSIANFEFDTRNETDYNNSEYLKVIPVPEEFYNISELVHGPDTNYIIEIFFLNSNETSKFLLIDDITFTDVTLNEMASIPTGYNAYESNNPMIREANQKRYKLSPEELREVLKYFSGLAGFGTGVYSTNLASRDATQTSGTLDVSGGSRISYRDSPIVESLAAAAGAGKFNLTNLAINEVGVEN